MPSTTEPIFQSWHNANTSTIIGEIRNKIWLPNNLHDDSMRFIDRCINCNWLIIQTWYWNLSIYSCRYHYSFSFLLIQVDLCNSRKTLAISNDRQVRRLMCIWRNWLFQPGLGLLDSCEYGSRLKSEIIGWRVFRHCNVSDWIDIKSIVSLVLWKKWRITFRIMLVRWSSLDFESQNTSVYLKGIPTPMETLIWFLI